MMVAYFYQHQAGRFDVSVTLDRSRIHREAIAHIIIIAKPLRKNLNVCIDVYIQYPRTSTTLWTVNGMQQIWCTFNFICILPL